MTSILKNVCIDKLADIVNKYNNKYHGTINMKLADPKSSTCIDFDKNNNKQDPIFRVGNHARIMTYINFLWKGYIPNWSEDVFLIKKNKNTRPWEFLISDFKGEEIVIIKLWQKQYRSWISFVQLCTKIWLEKRNRCH